MIYFLHKRLCDFFPAQEVENFFSPNRLLFFGPRGCWSEKLRDFLWPKIALFFWPKALRVFFLQSI